MEHVENELRSDLTTLYYRGGSCFFCTSVAIRRMRKVANVLARAGSRKKTDKNKTQFRRPLKRLRRIYLRPENWPDYEESRVYAFRLIVHSSLQSGIYIRKERPGVYRSKIVAMNHRYTYLGDY